jgi:hypothetical protein
MTRAKRIVALVGLLLAVGAFTWGTIHLRGQRPDPQMEQFLADSDQLIRGLQEYRKFVGAYPSGSAAEIASALSGQADSTKKVLVLATSLSRRNTKGEVLDPWGTPFQFFFSDHTVLIRSAGPNRIFEDHYSAQGDDLFRSDAK